MCGPPRRRARLEEVGDDATGRGRGRRAPAPSRPSWPPSCACARRGTRWPAPRRGPRAARALQDVGHLADLLGVDPAHHVGHGAAVERRGVEERRQHLGRRGVPELAVRRRPVGLGRLAQVGGDPAGLVPLRTPAEWGPGAGPGARAAGRVDAPHPPAPGAGAQRVAQQIALHTGRQHRTAPPEDGRHGQAGRLPALGRPDDHEGLGPLGGDARRPNETRDHAEEQPAGRGCARLDQQRTQVAPPGPASAAARRAAAWSAAPPSRYERPATSAPPSASGSTAAARPVIA